MPTPEQIQIRNLKSLTRNERRVAREIVRNYVQALDAVRADLARVYEKYAVDGVLTHAEMTKYNRLANLERQIVNDLRPLMSRNRRALERLTSVQYEEAFFRRAWMLDQATGVSLKWGLLNPATIRRAVENPLMEIAIKELTRSQVVAMNRAITQGLLRGSSLPRMMRDVRGVIETKTWEAMRIARTEAHRARELGNWDASANAAHQGVELSKQWDATLDNRTRGSHASMDGETRKVISGDDGISLESPFRSPNGGTAEMPGGFGIAAEDINCRCTLVDVVEGLEPELRRTQDGVQPYQTFGQWAEEHKVTGSRYGEKYNFVKR